MKRFDNQELTITHMLMIVVCVCLIGASLYLFPDAFDCMFSIGKYAK
jgi:hypothetical protein